MISKDAQTEKGTV